LRAKRRRQPHRWRCGGERLWVGARFEGRRGRTRLTGTWPFHHFHDPTVRGGFELLDR
jgi:hypothetical protein